MYYMECNELFSEEPNGFRRMRSCQDHLFVLATLIRNRKRNNLSTYACFIDFSRAFDGINITILWCKLSKLDMSGKILNIMKTMYAHIQSAVRLGVELTDWFSVDTGVRQGDNLAPTLFAIYINDFITAMKALNKGLPVGDDCVSCLAYADDVVLVASSHEDVQAMLDAVHVWCTQWRLKVNTFKTKIMHFRKKSVSCSDFLFHLGTHNLRVLLYVSISWPGLEHFSRLFPLCGCNLQCQQQSLRALVSRYYAMKGLHYGTYSKLYDSLVTPVIDYACVIWDTKTMTS